MRLFEDLIMFSTYLHNLMFKLTGLGFRPYETERVIEHESFKFFVGSYLAHTWYNESALPHGWPEMKFIKEQMITNNNEVIFECGAHHGFGTILLSKWIGPAGHIHAFDPIAENHAILQRNIKLNHLKNVTTHQKAVGASNGKICMSKSSNAAETHTRNPLAKTSVELVSLDMYQSLSPTILKIDVEGMEIEVLKGARQILKTRPKVAVEIHGTILQSRWIEIFQYLEQPMYDFWIQWDDDQAPIPYIFSQPLTKRCHLFAIPKTIIHDPA
jgi:FkbM family methyltransferase